MTQFYFDYRDHDGHSEIDDTGVDLLDLEAAYLEAYHAAIDLWAEARHAGRNLSRDQFLIRDENGRILVELPFAEALGVGG
jgi:hypothetical protein